MVQPATFKLMRKAFRVMNRYFMVPAFRLGLGSILGSPYGGYIMVIKTLGHKSGKRRFTPVNYAVANGCVYCCAGFGGASHWVKNMLAHPQVELLLPGRAAACQAEFVEDEHEKRSVLRRILINSGFAAFAFGGINPFRVSDEKLDALTREYLVLRFRPTGFGAGAADPGGWLWLWPAAALIYLLWLWLG